MMFRLVIFVLSVWFFPFQSLGSNSLATVRNRTSLSSFQRRFAPADQVLDNCVSHLSDKKSSLFQPTYFWGIDLDLDKDLKFHKSCATNYLTIFLLYPNEIALLDQCIPHVDLPVQSNKFLLFEQIKIPF